MDFASTIKPVITASKYFGLAPFTVNEKICSCNRYEKSKPLLIYSIILSVNLLLFYGLFSWALRPNVSEIIKPSIVDFTYYLDAICNHIVFIHSRFTSFVYQDKMLNILNQMSRLSEKLGLTYKYERYKRIIRFEIIFVFLVFGISFTLLLAAIDFNSLIVLALILHISIAISNEFSEVHFTNSVFLLGDLYKGFRLKLEKNIKASPHKGVYIGRINTISVIRNHSNENSLAILNPFNSESRGFHDETYDFSQLHCNLYDMTNAVNALYGVQNLFSITSQFLYVIQMMYYSCTEMMGLNVATPTPAILLFAIIYNGILRLCKLLLMNYACANVKSQAEELAYSVSKLQTTAQSIELRSEMQNFSLQLIHRKVQFTACGLFPIDGSLLYSMVGGITTYLVILIQFKQSQTNH